MSVRQSQNVDYTDNRSCNAGNIIYIAIVRVGIVWWCLDLFYICFSASLREMISASTIQALGTPRWTFVFRKYVFTTTPCFEFLCRNFSALFLWEVLKRKSLCFSIFIFLLSVPEIAWSCDVGASELLQMSTHLLSVSLLSWSSLFLYFLLLTPRTIPPVIRVSCRHSQKLHVSLYQLTQCGHKKASIDLSDYWFLLLKIYFS